MPIRLTLPIQSAGVSGKGKRIIPRWQQNLTINVPGVYMGRYEVVLRVGTIHNEGHFRGEGPKNRDFFGPLNGTSVAGG